jgi:hypothetical protein
MFDSRKIQTKAERLSETNPTPRTDLLGQIEMQKLPEGRSNVTLIQLVELEHIISLIAIISLIVIICLIVVSSCNATSSSFAPLKSSQSN